ncbi:hypothetical protein EYF80_039282 [Liparis tanakae]|uniref:Uncharacterized protein n=1 Tax=Liparis tanakae TaxID=230148 RepID=A0A4Z2GC76_9TELE|nr:hypothetical protein EYF80_039282 [Liparis tanakae]
MSKENQQPTGLAPAPSLATTSTTTLEITAGNPPPCNKELITEVQLGGAFFILFNKTLNQTTKSGQLDFMGETPGQREVLVLRAASVRGPCGDVNRRVVYSRRPAAPQRVSSQGDQHNNNVK